MDLRESHYQSAREFVRKAQQLGYGDLSEYYWYHTIELGNGLVTPGTYDYRYSLPFFQFPLDMSGMDVLDVGAATGFFSFEFEKRGANVVSMEMVSMMELDVFPGEDIGQTLKKLQGMMHDHSPYDDEQSERLFQEKTPEEIYFLLLEGPFQICRKILGSSVKRCYSSIYDLSPAKTGVSQFDLIFVGDVLLHTLYPVKALAALAPLCAGTLVIAQALPQIPDWPPAMSYVGGEKAGEDNISWFWPNRSCFEQILKKLGFAHVASVGNHTGIMKPGGGYYERAILHATR